MAIIVAVVGGFFFFSATASGLLLRHDHPAPALGDAAAQWVAGARSARPSRTWATCTSPSARNQHYAYCPPASGPHYNNPGIDGPIPAKFYGPDDGTRPEGWIHNLEHGAVVILYNCKHGCM